MSLYHYRSRPCCNMHIRSYKKWLCSPRTPLLANLIVIIREINRDNLVASLTGGSYFRKKPSRIDLYFNPVIIRPNTNVATPVKIATCIYWEINSQSLSMILLYSLCFYYTYCISIQKLLVCTGWSSPIFMRRPRL